MTYQTRRCRVTGDRGKLDFVWEIKYWDLRTLNNVKSNFAFNEMNKKDLPAMYSTVLWWRLVILIWQGPGPVATKMPFFRRNSNPLQIFSAPAQEGNLFFLSGRSTRRKLHNFLIKPSHLCRTSKHVWLSSSTCDHCCAYQLIGITSPGWQLALTQDGCRGSLLHSARA